MVLHGDSRVLLLTLAENSVDACVTDPPYEIGMMGSKWDATGIANDPTFWAQVYRVLKPGAHLLAFGGTRTYHRMTCAIEDAGFEIRDCLMWVYSTGFPKSHNISKAIDRERGATRPVLASMSAPRCRTSEKRSMGVGWQEDPAITGPGCAESAQWTGWGTALKPAWEPIVLARKPFEGTIARNVITHGTGALNVDGCRVGDETVRINRFVDGAKPFGGGAGHAYVGQDSAGRWPANVVHDGSDAVEALFPETGTSTGTACGSRARGGQTSTYGAFAGLPDQYGAPTGFGDSGSAARFFYCAKASRAEREYGCAHLPVKTAGEATGGRKEGSAGLTSPRSGAGRTSESGVRNFHPTVKPVALMRHLIRLITPPNGTVLDPFMGSGTTGCAAAAEHAQFIGMEQSAEYHAIATARIAQYTIDAEEPIGLPL